MSDYRAGADVAGDYRRGFGGKIRAYALQSLHTLPPMYGVRGPAAGPTATPVVRLDEYNRNLPPFLKQFFFDLSFPTSNIRTANAFCECNLLTIFFLLFVVIAIIMSTKVHLARARTHTLGRMQCTLICLIKYF